MMLNSAFMLLLRSFSAVMLMLVKKRYLMIYLVGDMALYLLQKVVRGDFYYWVPIDGVFGLLFSLLLRVGVKTITDFTGFVLTRGPQDLGGLYWTVNMALALAASGVCVWVSDGGRVKWILFGSFGGVWVLSFGLVLLLMKKEYRNTFVSTATGKQQIMESFLRSGDDRVKAKVLTKNKKMWWPIREEVKKWVVEGWWRWMEEKPEWFSLAWQSELPGEWVPEEARPSHRRRSSVVSSILSAFDKGAGEVRPVA